jgi:hypothetical protein
MSDLERPTQEVNDTVFFVEIESYAEPYILEAMFVVFSCLPSAESC